MIAALVLGFLITLFPDGTDSIGRPDTEYRGTCFVRCESAPRQSVYCHAAHRFAWDGSTVDCATHCRHDPARAQIPLPHVGTTPWRQAQSQWCLFVRETATGVYHWPSCHAENYQLRNLRQYGPADVECDYLTLPEDTAFEYTDQLPPEGSAMGAFLAPGIGYGELRARLKGRGRRVKRGRKPGSYVVREKARRQHGSE